MMPKRGAPTKSRQPPRPSAAKASSHQKYRPQWNEYLTDSSTYQLNQDQKLQKRIQMLTKIPTEVSAPRQPLAPPTKAKLHNNVQMPSRKPAVPRTNVAPLPLASQDKRSLPRVNFDDELRAFARESTSSVAAAETQKQHLQKELDRMDVMLASLELQADEISGVMEPRSLEATSSPNSNPDNNSTVDMTDTTFHHHEDNDQDDSVLATPSPTVAPTSPIDHDVVDLLHQFSVQLHEERQARESQDAIIRQLQHTLQDVMQSHAHLRDDFNRAVKHIVKLKAVVVNLRHTVHDVEDMMAAASAPSPGSLEHYHHHPDMARDVTVVDNPTTHVLSPQQTTTTPPSHKLAYAETDGKRGRPNSSALAPNNNQDTHDFPPGVVVPSTEVGGGRAAESTTSTAHTRHVGFHSRAKWTSGQHAEDAAFIDDEQPQEQRPMMPSRHTDDVRRRESVSIRHAMRT